MLRTLLAIASLALAAHAAAVDCTRSATVLTTAIGSGHRNAEASLADAVQAALDQAITQARGVYVASSSALWDSFRSSTAAGVSDVDLESGYSRDLSNRFSGFVESYDVLGRKELGGGVVEVRASVRVCLDERIAIGLPPGPATTAIVNALLNDVLAAGWHVVYADPGASATDVELFDFTLANGVTFIAQGDLATSLTDSRGMRSATVTLTARLIDTRTMQLAHRFSATRTGVGATTDAAVQMAGELLGSELAREWNRAFLPLEARQTAELVFRGVHRAGTKNSLTDIVTGIAGVLSVESATFDDRAGTVRLQLVLAGDACAIATQVPTYRRVRTELESCTGEVATFAVWGD